MKFRAPLIIVALTVLVCCSPSGGSESASDTSAPAPDTLRAVADVEQELPHVNIGYYWGDAFRETKDFEPFNKVYQEALAARKVRDSLWYAHTDGSTQFTAQDSAAFMPGVNKAYEAILQYKEQMKTGIKTEQRKRPVRSESLQPDDESHQHLRESSSTTLTNADFMFLGGAPFVTQQPEIFRDPSGNPETHYLIQIPENSEFFFNYVYSQSPGPIELSYGPPLNVYEGTEVEIKGIGSIKHVLKNRIPVWLLTSDGAVAATLVDVTMKLGYEYGCAANTPAYTFACSNNIDAGSIFGVFTSTAKIPVENAVSSSFPQIWEYDIDGDGNADLARIESTFSGAASDVMVVAIWYVKIGDDWAVLDYGTEPDCT